ncbi:MAG: acetylglutamate kinase [Gemmatimonadaceae bacterium]
MRVIKVGGRAQADPKLGTVLADAWRTSPGQVVVVHGGGDAVSSLQRTMGRAPTFIDGRRVTTAEDIDILRMTLSGASNKQLVASLIAAGAPAVGLSGEDGGCIVARPHDDPRLGAVGVPETIGVPILRLLLDSGWFPVVSPVAGDGRGGALNINADDAASAIAAALGAQELLLVSDVPGVLENGETMSVLDLETARDLIAGGTITAGMIAKLEAALDAVTAGVTRVRVGDVAAITDLHRGTTVVPARSLV